MNERLLAWVLKAGLTVAVLLSSSAASQEWGRVRHTGSLSTRDVFYSSDPKAPPSYVYVGGGIPTSLRFLSLVDPGGTKLLGWEGRFEPLLIGGRTVVVVPLKELSPGDRFLMVVKLNDGTEIPLTLTKSSLGVDGLVSFFLDTKSQEAVRHALEAKTEKVVALEAEARRERERGTSVDHALATLLARNEVALTPFRRVQLWNLRGEEADVEVEILARDRNLKVKSEAGKGKVAVVFSVTNKSLALPWELQEVRLTTPDGSRSWPYAFRSVNDSIPRGTTGRMAVVMDLSTFDPAKDGECLVLNIFRIGGYLQASVALDARELATR